MTTKSPFESAKALNKNISFYLTGEMRQRIEDLLRANVTLLEGHIQAVGGCDHDVGICICGEYAIVDANKDMIRELGGTI